MYYYYISGIAVKTTPFLHFTFFTFLQLTPNFQFFCSKCMLFQKTVVPLPPNTKNRALIQSPSCRPHAPLLRTSSAPLAPKAGQGPDKGRTKAR